MEIEKIKYLPLKMLKINFKYAILNTVKHISGEKISLFLTLDVNKITVDDVIGIVDSLTAVPATVFPGQIWYLEVCVVSVRGDDILWIFPVRAIQFKGDWRSAFNTTDNREIIPF